nr:MAG TPA: helix-turn-helix domain protein [Caudoviricetes sp.]
MFTATEKIEPSEEIDLKEILKSKRDQLGMSNQAVADESGLSIHTVNNFFSGRSKAASYYTVCMIAKAVHCSIDAAFQIEDDSLASVASQAMQNEHQCEIIALQERQIAELRKDTRAGRFAIYLSVVLGVIVLIYFFHYDVPNPDWGFTRSFHEFISWFR